MDGPSLGTDTHEFEPLDPSRECRRPESSEEQAKAGTASSVDAADCARSRTTSGAVASRAWAEQGQLGRPDASRTPKAPVRPKTESATGPEMDAPARASLETASYVYLQARAEEVRHFRRALKKTSKPGRTGNPCLPR